MHLQLPWWLIVVARVLFVSYFVSMGTSHLLYFQSHSEHLARKGVPLPQAATVLTVTTMVGGGLLILFNWYYWIGVAKKSVARKPKA